MNTIDDSLSRDFLARAPISQSVMAGGTT